MWLKQAGNFILFLFLNILTKIYGT